MSIAKNQLFSRTTATTVVIANMIGTGVFTSLGFQLLDIQSGFVLLLLWAVGGLIAICGALSYAELGASLPRSGGEYHFLTHIYHPAAGFVSGWISSTIGFSAPVALAAITFGTYLGAVIPDSSPSILAALLIILLTVIHATSRRNSGAVQRWVTLIKIALIVIFCAAILSASDSLTEINFLPANGDLDLITNGSFAIALIYVNYAYTGWNAATYLSSETENPQKNLPVILFVGTAMVTVLYLALNYTFLSVAPIDKMAGQLEIGYIVAEQVFGKYGATLMAVILAALLISTVSAMIVAGPRVLYIIGKDYPLFNLLGRTNANGVPAIAIVAQSILALIFVFTSSFQQIMVFASFTLGLNSLLTVLGVFLLRRNQPELNRPYRTFAYPVTPLIYLCLMGWTLFHIGVTRPKEALVAVALIAIGFIIYLITRATSSRVNLPADGN